jgi:thioredoxin 1
VHDDNSLGKIVLVMVLLGGAFFFYRTPHSEVELPHDTDFVRQVTSAKPVIVKFGAEWCPPCQFIESELDELVKTYGNNVHVVKIDVDARPDLAQHFRVRGIPHVMLFQYGKQVKEFKGARSAEDIAHWAGLK